MEDLQVVTFHNDEIPVFEGMFAVNIVAQNIGLDADSAVRNMKNDEILGPEACVYTAQVGKKQGRTYTMLPIQRLAGWLFSIHTNKVRPEVREKLTLYKRECYDVLHNHQFGGGRIQKGNIQKMYQLQYDINLIDEKINDLKGERKDKANTLQMLHIENYRMAGLWKDSDTERLSKKMKQQLIMFQSE